MRHWTTGTLELEQEHWSWSLRQKMGCEQADVNSAHDGGPMARKAALQALCSAVACSPSASVGLES